MQVVDWIGKGVVILVLLILLAQVVRILSGSEVAAVPAALDSWTKWTGAMIAIGLAIRGMAKGFRSLL